MKPRTILALVLLVTTLAPSVYGQNPLVRTRKPARIRQKPPAPQKKQSLKAVKGSMGRSYMMSEGTTKLRPAFEAYYNGQAGTIVSIGRALSLDGVKWEKEGISYILTPTEPYEGSSISHPSAVTIGDNVYLYYSVFNPLHSIARAVSTDGGRSFTKTGVVLSAAYLPTILYDPDDPDAAQRWKMWYVVPFGDEQEETGYAYSSDGKSWTRYGVVLPRVEDTWEGYSVLPGAVVKEGDTYKMLYTAKSGAGATGFQQSGYLTFKNPKSTYARVKDVPVIARKSESTQDLTEDTPKGSKVFTVESTADFSEGEYVFIDSAASEPYLNRIVSIDSKTQMTMRDPAPGLFDVAGNTRIRSIYYGSNHVRSVWKQGESWVAAVTMFHTFQDAGHVREVTAFATAPELSGPWTFDLKRGVALEINARSGDWDSISRENFSVVPSQRFAIQEYIPPVPPRLLLKRGTHQWIPPGGSYHAISWDEPEEPLNAAGMWAATHPTRITFPESGFYAITVTGYFGADGIGNVGKRYAVIRKNGTNFFLPQTLTPDILQPAPSFHIPYTHYFNEGDYIEVLVSQTSRIPLVFASTGGIIPSVTAIKQ